MAIRLNFKRFGSTCFYTVAPQSQIEVQDEGGSNPINQWVVPPPPENVVWLRLPFCHRDQWEEIASRLTGISKTRLRTRGIEVYDAVERKTYHL